MTRIFLTFDSQRTSESKEVVAWVRGGRPFPASLRRLLWRRRLLLLLWRPIGRWQGCVAFGAQRRWMSMVSSRRRVLLGCRRRRRQSIFILRVRYIMSQLILLRLRHIITLVVFSVIIIFSLVLLIAFLVLFFAVRIDVCRRRRERRYLGLLASTCRDWVVMVMMMVRTVRMRMVRAGRTMSMMLVLLSIVRLRGRGICRRQWWRHVCPTCLGDRWCLLACCGCVAALSSHWRRWRRRLRLLLSLTCRQHSLDINATWERPGPYRWSYSSATFLIHLLMIGI